MENTILDDLKEPDHPYYAKKAFRQFCWALVIYILGIPLLNALLGLAPPVVYLTIVLLMAGTAVVLNVLGMLNGFKSIRLGERSNWRKYIGAIGNLLVVVLAVTLILRLGIDVFETFIR